MVLLFMFILFLGTSKAGFRCTLGEWACSASCVTIGQSSGICDLERNCICSERLINMKDLRALLPSRCDLGAKFCEATCNSIGRRNGTCGVNDDGLDDCKCSDEFLSPTEFALCGAESTCRLDCQRRGMAAGQCFGWTWKCESEKSQKSSIEFTDWPHWNWNVPNLEK